MSDIDKEELLIEAERCFYDFDFWERVWINRDKERVETLVNLILQALPKDERPTNKLAALYKVALLIIAEVLDYPPLSEGEKE
jgi:hypothetical protein